MSQSNLSGPLNIDGNLVVGGSATITGGIGWNGGTIAVADTIDAAGGTISVADVTATGVVAAGNFTSLGTAGIHNALTVHSLVDEGALTALGTVGLGATTSSGLIQAANLSSAGTLGVTGNTTLAGTSLVFGTQQWRVAHRRARGA
jgi:hypothetical protein